MAKVMNEVEKEQFRLLNRLRMKDYRDRKRKRGYAPRGRYRDSGKEEVF